MALELLLRGRPQGDVAQAAWASLVSPKLFLACRDGDRIEARRMLELGVDVNHTSADGNTPLCMACLSGCRDVAELLLNRNANPNQAGAGGNLPLIIAAVNDNVGLTRLLLKHGADIRMVDREGNTALMVACIYAPRSSFDLILQRKSSLAWTKLFAVFFAIKLVARVRRARERVYMPGGRGARAAEASFEWHMLHRS